MGLLHQIQEAVVREDVDLGSILLKLRLLASRLGSKYLEEWVEHEAEGYPEDVDVPAYRKIGVKYSATFSGPFGRVIQNAPIPLYLIQQYAGESWVSIEMRESVATIQSMAKTREGGGALAIDASNLILLLQGKIYDKYACNEVNGIISRSSLAEITQAVRSRVLALTLELEESIPSAGEIQFGPVQSRPESADEVRRISHQVIFGNVTTVTGGAGSKIALSIAQGPTDDLVRELSSHGIPERDAAEFAEILASEKPQSADEPFGARARAWLGENLKKAASGSWNVGISVATKVLSEAALKYYGLK